MMKTWLITGCSSGIGTSIAKAVLESGDQAVVTARDKSKVQSIVDMYPKTALALSLDVCDNESIENAVNKAYEYFQTIDVLVNNAGYGYRSAIEEGKREIVDKLFQTNLFGAVDEQLLIYKDLYFIFQGAAHTTEQLQAGEYTISSFAKLYGMTYKGMITNKQQAQ